MWDLTSLTKDRTCIPYIARQILNHWTTREASDQVFLNAPSIEAWKRVTYFQKKWKKRRERNKQMRNGGLKVMSINNITLAPWPSDVLSNVLSRKNWDYTGLLTILSECPWNLHHMELSFHQECPNFRKVENSCHEEPLKPSCFTDGET